MAEAGLKRIDWALSEMPVVAGLIEELAAARPLEGLHIGGCLHITAETANLARALVGAGADLALCASNPLSTQDEVTAALVAHLDVPVFARRGEGEEEYYRNIEAVLERRPQITPDDGADLVSAAHKRGGEILAGILGGTEETTTGVVRLRAMAARVERPRPSVEEFHLADGRRIRLLAEGRLVNLGVAEGHPAAVMDMSFANQALSVVYLAKNHAALAPGVLPVPSDIDQEVAKRKLESMSVAIDRLTPEQSAYLASWREGT